MAQSDWGLRREGRHSRFRTAYCREIPVAHLGQSRGLGAQIRGPDPVPMACAAIDRNTALNQMLARGAGLVFVKKLTLNDLNGPEIIEIYSIK